MRWFSKRARTEAANAPVHVPAPVPIEGHGERNLASLHNIGQLTRVETGQPLFQQGESGRKIFLVLKGAFRFLPENNAEPIAADIFKEGDWIGELPFSDTPKKTIPVIAMEPSSVLGINDSSFRSLDPKIQSSIYGKLNHDSMLRMEELGKSAAEARLRSDYLSMYIRKQASQKNQNYEQSEILSNLFKNLPRLPMHTSNLVNLLLDGNASAREITQLAKQDPSLVTEILKTINSSYYNLHCEISDIQYAMTYMGFNQVYQIVISDGLRKSMPKTKEFKELHEHSVMIADLVFEICNLHDRKLASTMSTIALLHDVGKSIVLLLKMQNPKLEFFIDVLDASKIGSMLLQGWNIPKKVHETIEYQDYPQFMLPTELPSDEKESIAMLFIAHAVYDYMVGKSDGNLQNPFVKEYMERLNFRGLSVAELVDKYILNDLKLKMDTLPMHVRALILAKGISARVEVDKTANYRAA
ncbi:MAG: HDOD domain-containing protein [Syntrophobacteraceae bacterium]